MACYEPRLMLDTGMINPETGKKVFRFLGRAVTALDPAHPDSEYYYLVPCNRCIGCRLDYARDWSNRMLLEMADQPNGIFVTLTYNNDNLPLSDLGYPTTSVRDCQLFFKKLRKHFAGVRIRYFLGAEYGPRNLRPHYHAIIFGLSLDHFDDLRLLKMNKLGQPLYTSLTFEKIWKNGFVTLGKVTQESCSYVARYMLKKLKGKKSKEYEDKHIAPEFSLCSRRPGIGLGYLDIHPEAQVRYSVFDGKETIEFPIPRKLLDKVFEIDPEQYEVLKSVRRYSALTSNFLEWQKTDLKYLEYLDLKETQLYNRIKGVAVETRLDI